MPVFVILLFIAVAVGLWLYGRWAAEKRRQALAAWAARRGLRFSPGEDAGMDGRFPHFDCLQNGDNRYAYNVSEGTLNGRDLRAFDYHYQTYSRDSKGRRQTHHHHFSALILRTGLPLKPLFLRPEGFLDRLGELVGWDDIDFESAEFSRRFYVKAPERRWAFDVISQETMELLLASPEFKLEMEKGDLILWRDGMLGPEALDQALELGEGILARLPRDLLRQWQEGKA